MLGAYESSSDRESESSHLQIVRYAPFKPFTKTPWLELRVFYVRISNFYVDDLTPEFLSLTHIPLSPDALLEVNGYRDSTYSTGVSLSLRRDRVDKVSEEVTYVCTDCIRLTGNVKFEVFDKEDMILSGILEIANANGYIGDYKGNSKRWSMNCQPDITVGTGFLKAKHVHGDELLLPTIEVYVTGWHSGTPIILTKTLVVNYRKKHNRKAALDVIPENESTESPTNASHEGDLQVSEYGNYKGENEDEFRGAQWRTEYMEGEDGELSWFNAGVRVGVGIGLGICLGIGIGIGLLVRTYQTTTRNFRRRLP